MNNESILTRRELGRLGVAGLAATVLRPMMAEAAPLQQKSVSLPMHDMSGYGIPDGPPQQIAMLLYPELTVLDLIGPYQFLSGVGNVEIHLVWKTKNKPIVSDAGVSIVPTTTFAECPDNLTMLFVPGGAFGTVAVMEDKTVLDFLAKKGKTAKWVTSVCTGSLVLGAAGLLKGYKATSHWSVRDEILPLVGATPVKARVVEDRNRVTGAGVTAGMDLALRLAAKLRNEKMAKAIQLGMEYDPQPPYQAGTPEGAGTDIVSMIHTMDVPLRQGFHVAAEKARKLRA